MAKTATAVPYEQYEAVVKEFVGAGRLGSEVKAGWLKIFGKGGPKGPRIYVPLQVKVRRVDISGGLMLQAFTQLPPGGAFGSVKQCLDLDGITPDEVMERFRAALETLETAPVPEKKVRAKKPGQPAPKPESQPEGMTPEKAALMAKVAAEMGVPLSESAQKSIDEMPDLSAEEEDDILERLTAPTE